MGQNKKFDRSLMIHFYSPHVLNLLLDCPPPPPSFDNVIYSGAAIHSLKAAAAAAHMASSQPLWLEVAVIIGGC